MGRGEEIKYWLTHKATTYHIALGGLILSDARWASGSRNMPGTTGLTKRVTSLATDRLSLSAHVDRTWPGIKSGADIHLATRCRNSVSDMAAYCYAVDPRQLARSRYR